MIPWYKKSFGHEYLRLYAHRNDDEALTDIKAIIKLLSPSRDKPLLDLGCGAGRHLIALHQLGFRSLTGLDLSEELLQVAKERLIAAGASDVKLLCRDMRYLPQQEHFAVVLSLFTTFGYFAQDEENAAVLRSVYQGLQPQGKFLIDYINREYLLDNLVPSEEKTLAGKQVKITRQLTADQRRIEKSMVVTTAAGKEEKFFESVRLYHHLEMEEMLKRAGFVDIRKYGALSGELFNHHSERLILIAEKRS
jgi:ubiquinone/menaquinone biosynthesis C-methylase UbiE